MRNANAADLAALDVIIERAVSPRTMPKRVKRRAVPGRR
jgi:hypothetical protein